MRFLGLCAFLAIHSVVRQRIVVYFVRFRLGSMLLNVYVQAALGREAYVADEAMEITAFSVRQSMFLEMFGAHEGLAATRYVASELALVCVLLLVSLELTG